MNGSGLPYHRRFTVRPGKGSLEAHMQDHCHHLRVVVDHEAGRILHASAEGLRLPWNTCPLAAAGVGRIAGMEVSAALDPAAWPGGRTANCVHAVDLTMVALAHLDDTEPFRYSITVTPAMAQVRTARLERNGSLVLEWTLDGDTLRTPDSYARRTLRRPDFSAWTGSLDPADREAATVLRRACHIAPSRDIDLDSMQTAADSISPDSSCYTLQPGIIEQARRVRGSSRTVLTAADEPS